MVLRSRHYFLRPLQGQQIRRHSEQKGRQGCGAKPRQKALASGVCAE